MRSIVYLPIDEPAEYEVEADYVEVDPVYSDEENDYVYYEVEEEPVYYYEYPVEDSYENSYVEEEDVIERSDVFFTPESVQRDSNDDGIVKSVVYLAVDRRPVEEDVTEDSNDEEIVKSVVYLAPEDFEVQESD